MTDRDAAPGVVAGWADAVLQFWFEELARADWFKRSDATDRVIGDRFLTLYEAIAAFPPAAADLSAREALAAVIVLDQFPRNLFRGEARAFASDGAALQLAREAIALGYDGALEGPLAITGRLFLYLPFEHSETLADQDRAVELISRLGDAEFTRYAIAHRDIIARFGRFPHRNAVIGRESTAEEIAFLAQPGSSF